MLAENIVVAKICKTLWGSSLFSDVAASLTNQLCHFVGSRGPASSEDSDGYSNFPPLNKDRMIPSIEEYCQWKIQNDTNGKHVHSTKDSEGITQAGLVMGWSPCVSGAPPLTTRPTRLSVRQPILVDSIILGRNGDSKRYSQRLPLRSTQCLQKIFVLEVIVDSQISWNAMQHKEAIKLLRRLHFRSAK